jgi:hypothetical protein
MSTHNTTATRATNVGDRAASPSAVHDHVCEFVAAQAEAETADCGGWTGYRDVFLSAEVQDLTRLRLHDQEGGTAEEVACDGAPTKKKKRKLDGSPCATGDGQGEAADVDAGTSSNVGQGGSKNKKRMLDAGPAHAAGVSWTVCCLDGATFSAVVPEQAQVAEIKRAIATLREVPRFTMELFVKGVEEPLDEICIIYTRVNPHPHTHTKINSCL